MTIRRGRGAAARSTSAGADNRDRCNLDVTEKAANGTERRTRVLARLAEHLREKIRCAVDDLRLSPNSSVEKHEASQLQQPARRCPRIGRRLLSGQEVESTRARRVRRLLDTHLVGGSVRSALPIF